MKYALHFMGQVFNGINIQRGENLTPVEHPEGLRFNGAPRYGIFDPEGSTLRLNVRDKSSFDKTSLMLSLERNILLSSRQPSMSCPLRIECPGAFYHVINRAIGGNAAFLTDND
jgi:hypothetical protein